MTKPASFRELIDATFGGRDAFATATGIDIGHVDVMKHRNSIAPEHWPAIVSAAEKLKIGVTIADLAGLRAKRREEARASRSAGPDVANDADLQRAG